MVKQIFRGLCIISFLFIVAVVINTEIKPYGEFERQGTKEGAGWQLNYTLVSKYDQEDYYYLLMLEVVCDKHTPVTLMTLDILTKPCLPSVPASYMVNASNAGSLDYTIVVDKTYIKLNGLVNDLATDR